MNRAMAQMQETSVTLRSLILLRAGLPPVNRWSFVFPCSFQYLLYSAAEPIIDYGMPSPEAGSGGLILRQGLLELAPRQVLPMRGAVSPF